MQECLPLSTNQDNLITVILTWKSVVHDTYDMLFTMPPNTVCHWDENFGAYLAKKRAEGKHYNVALSHATKKLVRLIYQLEKSGQQYVKAS